MKISRNVFLTLLLTVATFLSLTNAGAQTESLNIQSSPGTSKPAVESLTFTGLGGGPIPDGFAAGPNSYSSPREMSFYVSGITGPIRKMTLSITMTHTWIGDLEIILQAPEFQGSHLIMNRVGAGLATSLGDNSNLDGTYKFGDIGTANPWTVATDPACGDNCVVTPQHYHTTVTGPTSTPAAVTSLNAAFGTFTYPNGRWVLRIRDGAAGDTGAVTAASLKIETPFSWAPFDFDGDDKTDISIHRPSGSEWWINRSSNGSTFALQFGLPTDKIVPADYTGDGKTDIAVFRPGTGEWYVLRSEDSTFFGFPFGSNGDIPAPGDFDGDGADDFAIFRPPTGTWFMYLSTGGTRIFNFGANGDIPAVGDYNRDGVSDPTVFRPNTSNGAMWWIQMNTNGGILALPFGLPTDKPVPGDYTGDGKTDPAVWRPSTGEWRILRSEEGHYATFYSFPFGMNGDVPAPGDYDGDGTTDAAVFRPSSSTWYIGRSDAGLQVMQFGANGDRPIPNAFVP